MSQAKTFIDYLKSNDIHEAINVIKECLAERAQEKVAEQKLRIAESFGLKPIVEEEDDDMDDDEDDDEEDDEEKDDEDEE